MRHPPADPLPPRAAIYCRFSSEMQNPRSVTDQVKLCQRYAERQGWPPIPPEAVFADEQISGDISQRPAYQRLLAMLASGSGQRPEVVLTEGFDRLARDKIERAWLERMAPIWDLRIISVSDDQEITEDGAEYKLIEDQRYLKTLRKKIRRGLSGRFADGFHPGGSIYGYTTLPVPHPSGRLDRWGRPILLGHRLVPKPEEAAIVRRIYVEAAAGRSPRDIAHGLDQDRVPKPCCRYEYMTKGAARQTTPWFGGTVLSILRNERYRGLWRYQQMLSVGTDPDTGRKVMRAVPEEALEQQRDALRLIDDSLWHQVQAVLNARAMGERRDPATGRPTGWAQGRAPGAVYGKGTHALNGLLTCGVCRGPVNILRTTTTPDGARVPYVGCQNHHRFKGYCANAGLARLPDLEAALRAALPGYFAEVEPLRESLRRFLRAVATYRAQLTQEEERARAAVAEIASGTARGASFAGLIGERTQAMLAAAAAMEVATTAALAEGEAAQRAEPRRVPAAEILRGLPDRHRQERQYPYHRLLREVRLRSERAPGRKLASRWVAELVPREDAGLEGLPTSVALGKGVITVGYSLSG